MTPRTRRAHPPEWVRARYGASVWTSLQGVAATGGDVWAAGMFDNGGNERPYVETTP